MLSRLAFVAGLALWQPASADTFYDCQTSWGTGSVNCVHAAAYVMINRVGCDGKAFIPEKPAIGYADICTATLSAPGHKNGVVVSDVALMRMFKPLIDRCGIGSFCDQDTGICGTLTTRAGSGKRGDDQLPVDDEELLALEEASNSTAPGESPGQLDARQQQGCNVPYNNDQVIYRQDGRYRFQRLGATGATAEDRAPPASMYNQVRDAGQTDIRTLANQNNNQALMVDRSRDDGRTYGLIRAAPAST
ncbi:hypothetical protein B0J13DRAFT_557050, partial [Dactylonectria estremocensis]